MSVLNFRRFTRPDRLKSIAPRNLNQLLTPYADWLGTRGYVLPAGDSQPDYTVLSQILAKPAADTSTTTSILCRRWIISRPKR